MHPNDDNLRLMLISRARRAPTVDLGDMVDQATKAPPEGRWSRIGRMASLLRDSAAMVVLAGLLVTALSVGVWAHFGGSTTALPVGLWQSEQPVGTGAVGSETCVAIELTDATYRSGRVRVWWWLMGSADCRTSTSGPMETTATLTEVRLPGAGALAERTGFVVELELQLLPSGTETVAFTLDPMRVQSTSSLVAYSDRNQSGRVLLFTSVRSLDVQQPGGTPVPTPGRMTTTCVGGVPRATCDDAARVALATVVSTGWTPTRLWVNSGVFCPREDCLFDPSQNFPYPLPPSNGTWVANVEIAFAETDRHAGLMIDQVGTNLVPVLIGYRVPLPGWCSGQCP
jgi:hypothetical protein